MATTSNRKKQSVSQKTVTILKVIGITLALGYLFVVKLIFPANDLQVATERGVPALVQERVENTRTLKAVESDSSRLYLLFDGVMEVYDHNGNYQYAFYFQNERNGAFRIGHLGNQIIVLDKTENLYYFENGSFSSYAERETDLETVGQIRSQNGSDDYFVKWGSVWKHTENGGACVIRRPYNWYPILCCAFIIICLIVTVILNRQKHKW